MVLSKIFFCSPDEVVENAEKIRSTFFFYKVCHIYILISLYTVCIVYIRYIYIYYIYAIYNILLYIFYIYIYIIYYIYIIVFSLFCEKKDEQIIYIIQDDPF